MTKQVKDKVQYRFYFECSLSTKAVYEETVEFDKEPTEAELEEAYLEWAGSLWDGGYEKVEK